MSIFEVWVHGTDWKETVIAPTAGKAKYRYWLGVTDAYEDVPITAMRSRKVGTVGTFPEGLTERERELARHAMGLPNRRHVTYRNYFYVTEPDDEWESLVNRGLAIKRDGGTGFHGAFFHLTFEGARLAILPHEHIGPEEAESMRRMVAGAMGRRRRSG